jgi:hypothetical protein
MVGSQQQRSTWGELSAGGARARRPASISVERAGTDLAATFTSWGGVQPVAVQSSGGARPGCTRWAGSAAWVHPIGPPRGGWQVSGGKISI